MENKTDGQNKNYKRKVMGYIIIGIIILGIGYFYGLPIIKQKIGEKRVDDLVRTLKQTEEEDYKLALADTYGGNTPQETLDMFIEAVEKGDYELASKYFVIPKQEEWRNELLEINKADKIDTFLDPIKIEMHNQGIFSKDENSYSIYGRLVINLWKYPSGNWKIQDF